MDSELLLDRHLEDGAYAVSDACKWLVCDFDAYSRFQEGNLSEAEQEFITRYPDFVVASAYETFTVILLSEKPTKLSESSYVGVYGQGATALFESAPKNLLILAGND
jgi:hypothetical protein